MSIRKIILIQPGRDGRKFGRATSEPYTLMRLASLVPLDIPVEIWDEDLMRLPIETLGKGDLVGITAKTLLIDRAKVMSRRIQAQGATVVMGGTHTTLVPGRGRGLGRRDRGGRRLSHLAADHQGLRQRDAPAALLR